VFAKLAATPFANKTGLAPISSLVPRFALFEQLLDTINKDRPTKGQALPNVDDAQDDQAEASNGWANFVNDFDAVVVNNGTATEVANETEAQTHFSPIPESRTGSPDQSAANFEFGQDQNIFEIHDPQDSESQV
jgi:hypothetical protein